MMITTALQAFYCVLLICILLIYPTTSQAVALQESVALSLSQQTLANIKTQPLVVSQYQPELQAYAQVMDLQNLLTLREQYFAAQTELQSANNALHLLQQAIARTETLYRSGVNSQRQLQEQQMAHNLAQARANSSQHQRQSIQDKLTTVWGSLLSTWVITDNHPEFRNIIKGQQALLLLSLPAGHSLPPSTAQINVSPVGNRQTPQSAQLVASAPQGSDLNQGETYFFTTPRAKLRTGMRLSAWIAAPEKPLTGFIVPASALIWRAGSANIYLQTAPTQFQRLTITDYYPVKQGYFIASAFPVNAKVVTTGAQTLLSQEFRNQIPAEEDNDGD